jgi:16S rRNA (cytidine1402-2'-O)-methyltransferase
VVRQKPAKLPSPVRIWVPPLNLYSIMLYLIATPIGNLKDITLRALETLKECDLILCEDTRVSKNLLIHYQIEKPLKSFHQFNEASQEEQIIEKIKNGASIALISDAGTPGISDPGSRLVQRCRQENLPVTSLPGPCAAITAISGSGLSTNQFQFVGFLPRKEGALKEILVNALMYSGTTICYESPRRLVQTLQLLQQLSPEKQIVVGRELTKKFEEYRSGSVAEVLDYFQKGEIKGEIVLLIAGTDPSDAWKSLSPESIVEYFQETFKLSAKESVKLAAEISGLSKKELYKRFFH